MEGQLQPKETVLMEPDKRTGAAQVDDCSSHRRQHALNRFKA